MVVKTLIVQFDTNNPSIETRYNAGQMELFDLRTGMASEAMRSNFSRDMH